MSEMIKTTTAICRTCYYGKGFTEALYYCDYVCMTGEPRGCKVGECDKYTNNKTRKNLFSIGELSR